MSAPKQVPAAETLTIPRPTIPPLGIPVTSEALQAAWDEVFVPIYSEGPQSIEERVIAGTLRAVFAGLAGIHVDPDVAAALQQYERVVATGLGVTYTEELLYKALKRITASAEADGS